MGGSRDSLGQVPTHRMRSEFARPKRSQGSNGMNLFAIFMFASAVLLIAQRRRAAILSKFAEVDEQIIPRVSFLQAQLIALGNRTAAAAYRPENHGNSKGLQRDLDRTGVPEEFTTIRQDWKEVIIDFMDDSPHEQFSARKIREHFYSNTQDIQKSCMLVTIKDGNVTFEEKYEENKHSRASSVKYMVRKIVQDKGRSLAGATFLVMVTDGTRPTVPTFGSARHWKSWKLMIPVPLGNSRGQSLGWGTPLEGWDKYVSEDITKSHVAYPWASKVGKAVFRGSLGMQTYKLGSCNEENSGRCERAESWRDITRGVMYQKAARRPELFDVGFTQIKPKDSAPDSQLDGAPDLELSIDFLEYQKYKYILNIGSNQDWAERLRGLLYMNSAVIVHMAESREFFTPLMRPWVHFIPTNLLMDDLVANVKWATENDVFTQQIVRNQNAFADRYISERAMQQYWEVLLEEFSIRQSKAAGAESGSQY